MPEVSDWVPTTDGGAVELPRAIDAVHPRELAEHADVTPSEARDILEALHRVEWDRKPWRDPETLRQLYYGEGLTYEKLAARLDVGKKAVQRGMAYHGLGPGRGRSSDADRALMAMDPEDLNADD